MPTYLYTCLHCGKITELRDVPIDERDNVPDQPCVCGTKDWKRGMHPTPHICPKFKGGAHGAKLGSDK
jgi:hypothetical protein